MFWNKKQNKNSSVFTYESKDRREAFRVKPAAQAPIILKLENKKLTVVNISAKGLSFRDENFKKGAVYPVSFNVPGQGLILKTKTKIISIDADNFCHGEFVSLNDKKTELIHHYVLCRQKQILKKNKSLPGEDDSNQQEGDSDTFF